MLWVYVGVIGYVVCMYVWSCTCVCTCVCACMHIAFLRGPPELLVMLWSSAGEQVLPVPDYGCRDSPLFLVLGREWVTVWGWGSKGRRGVSRSRA